MSDRTEKLLKRLCLLLALLLVYPLARLATRDTGLKALASLTLPRLELAASPATTNQSPRGPLPPGDVLASLPEPVRLQVERITQSEILGPVIRPQPVALLGIAGPDAFLRSPNGRTGLLRAGETLDGIKLVRVGTNRVVIEELGKQRELTIFSGLGSETLIPPTQEKKP